MPDLGHRRPRRLPMTALVGLVLAGLLLPASVGVVFGADPTGPGRGDIVATFDETPTFGTAAVQPGTVGIKSATGYEYGDNATAVVGEILNLRSLRTKDVLVTVTWLDDDDQEISTDTAYVYLEQTSRGGVAPFVVYDENGPCDQAPGDTAPCAASYFVDASAGSATSVVAGGALDITPGPSVPTTDFRYYEGTITNPNPFTITDVTAMLTVYDADGTVIEAFDQNDLADLGPGETIGYSIGVDIDLDEDTAGSAVLVDAQRADNGNVYVTSWANYFDDLPTVTFRRDIVWLAEQRITTGCAPGRYCPSSNVTRAQMAQFLDRALGLPATDDDFFTDDNGVTGEASINRLAASGITGGCTATRFCPSNSVTRGQMAAFLDRALDLPPTSTDFFTDDETSTFEGSINRLAAAGITGGCGGTKYCPTASVTRGQMAAFLRRAFEE